MRVLESEHSDIGAAGCGPGEVLCVQCAGGRGAKTRYDMNWGDQKANIKGLLGIKEYSEWPTIPQLYVDKEFVGGCDILVAMHQNGELAKMLEEKKVLVPAEGGAEGESTT